MLATLLAGQASGFLGDEWGSVAAVDALQRWASALGVSFHPALFLGFNTRRGWAFAANEPVAKDSVLMRVPREMLFTASAATPARSAHNDSADADHHYELALALLSEVAPGSEEPSYWASYLATLPKAFHTPLYYTALERRALNGSEVLRQLAAREGFLQVAIERMGQSKPRTSTVAVTEITSVEDRFDRPSFSPSDVRWAFSVVWSRAFFVNFGNEPQLALVPMADLINHKDPLEANVGLRSEADALVLFATRRINPDDELTRNYGDVSAVSNAQLLLDYGFVEPWDPHLVVRLEEDLAGSDEPQPGGHHAAAEGGSRLTLTSASTPTDWLEHRHLLVAIGRRLAGYTSTLDEDEDALAKLPPEREPTARERRARDALEIVAAEKRVLHLWRRFLLRPSDKLGPSPSDLRHSAADVLLAASAGEGHTFRPSGTYLLPDGAAAPRAPADVWLRVVGTRGAPRPRGVFVVSGTLQMGDLVGCSGGELLSEGARQARRKNPALDSSWEDYALRFNRTHVLDPTSAETGRVDDTSPPFRWEMALVNEPGPGRLPNLVSLGGGDHARCLDRFGSPGVPYYAVRQVQAGAELSVCYGPSYNRHAAYVTSCSETALLTRWERQMRVVLQPFLGREPKSRTHLQL